MAQTQAITRDNLAELPRTSSTVSSACCLHYRLINPLTSYSIQNLPANPAKRLSTQRNASTEKDAPTSPSSRNARGSATQFQSGVPSSTPTDLAANRNKTAATNANASSSRPQPHPLPLPQHPKRRLLDDSTTATNTYQMCLHNNDPRSTMVRVRRQLQDQTT